MLIKILQKEEILLRPTVTLNYRKNNRFVTMCACARCIKTCISVSVSVYRTLCVHVYVHVRACEQGSLLCGTHNTMEIDHDSTIWRSSI